MKKDMESNLNSHIDAQKETLRQNNCMQNPLNNDAQESMIKRIEKSTEFFLNHQDIVEAYLDFCDGLVEKGETLEKAIEKSDKVFAILQDKNTYNQD